GGVSVGQCLFDIGNSRTLVFERQPDPFARAFLQALDQQSSAASVIERIAGQLAGRSDDFRLIDQAQTDLDGAGAHFLTDAHDVITRSNLNEATRQYGHRDLPD